ncbi:unnamed protein product [Allacma fusca]|uniref:Uncharacterized protein n=1 Tax=Allacma fusca TaxID=39272 RepID=A0A8J2KPX7_9HEXA|nr:unnamed protein product [Allacma fusca]
MHILEIAALVLCLHVLVVQSEVDLSKPLDSKIHEAIETNYTRLPHGVYLKAYSYMKNSKVFKNFTFEEVIEWIDNADKWDSPDLSRRFPYYLSGYDYEDRPSKSYGRIMMRIFFSVVLSTELFPMQILVWIAEVGKYNVRKVVEKGSEGTADLERYTFQGVIRCLKR